MTTSSNSGRMLKILLPVLILAIGIAGFIVLDKLKTKPQRVAPPQLGTLVEVMELQAEEHQVRVHATGTVSAEQEISLTPEVSGKVVWLSPRLVAGGFFRAGELLLKIEPSDYLLAAEKARADIARAEVALRTEQERAKVALQEWQRIELADKGQPGPLVSREIQLQQERASLAAARASLRQAELNLQRTELKAPFNGRVRQEMVDLGQYLRAGTSIGSFSGTDRAEIQVPLPLAELRWLSIPSDEQAAGSQAIIQLPEQPTVQWQGRLVRSLGEVDAASRMVTLVIAIEDPYQLQATADTPVLRNGQFVEIQLLGERLKQVISIPRESLRSGQQIWIADAENRLRVRPVTLLRREQRQLLLESGVESGERLVLTTLSGAADGLLLRPVLRENGQ